MSVSAPRTTVTQAIPASRTRRRRLSALLDREDVLGYLFVAPLLILLLGLVAYPFGMGLVLSVTNKTVGGEAHFVGLANFVHIWQDQIYQQTVHNTIIYTVAATILKVTIGFGVALLINQQLPLRKFIRAVILLPWIVPTVLSAMAWQWMFTPNFSVLNWIILQLGWSKTGVPWLTDSAMAMVSVIIVNTWRGIPFFAITILAGLQSIPQELYEATSIDGAGVFARFKSITLPLVMPVLVIALVLSIIWTFSDFQVVYGLTGGGPMNSTHVLATLSYAVGLQSGELGQGAAISLTMLPLLLILLVWQVRHVHKSEAR